MPAQLACTHARSAILVMRRLQVCATRVPRQHACSRRAQVTGNTGASLNSAHAPGCRGSLWPPSHASLTPRRNTDQSPYMPRAREGTGKAPGTVLPRVWPERGVGKQQPMSLRGRRSSAVWLRSAEKRALAHAPAVPRVSGGCWALRVDSALMERTASPQGEGGGGY